MKYKVKQVFSIKTTRIDALDKVLGRAKYVEDFLDIKDLHHARIFGSQHAHAIMESVDYDEAIRLGAVDVVTYKDIPGVNAVGYIPEMPALAHGKVRYFEEHVAIVIARSPEVAERAVEGIRVGYRPLPAVTDITKAFTSKEVLVHEEKGSNIAYEFRLSKGDVASAFDKADVVVSNRYVIASRKSAYIEREAALAIPNSDGRMDLIVANQNPHVVAKDVARVLNISEDMVRITTPYVGGGFGGKNDMGIIVGAQAALAAYKVKKPVLLVYSRRESFTRASRSEEAIIEYHSAASGEGKLLGVKIRILLDSGAYAIRSPGILWRLSVEATGPYYVPNIDLTGYCVYTNKVYVGALRGFGTPSAAIAHEAQMELLARKLRIDPLELRLKNLIVRGAELPTQQILEDNVDFIEVLKRLHDVSGWFSKKYGRGFREGDQPYIRRGIGVGCAWHGISIGGGYGMKEVEIKDWVDATAEIDEDGRVVVKTGIVELGQGTSTAFAMIASEILGVSVDNISIVTGTTEAPDTGGTHASRGLAFGGLAVEKASRELKREVVKHVAKLTGCQERSVIVSNNNVSCMDTGLTLSWREMAKMLMKKGIKIKVSGRVDIPRGVYDPKTGRGHAWPTYAFSAIVSEVEVNLLTGEVRVTRVYPAVDVGTILNPSTSAAQVEGGITFGIGASTMEELIFDGSGSVANDSLSTYHIPTLADITSV
ncbi:MAG: xanthine dehydrogenase family protein molybdopterin-binding subunit, partial [Zestosphaera sp.]